MSKPTNVVVAGLGGQGVIKASDILADVAFSSGVDVKKSELHGMSQRGGSVSSDVRFGEQVFSPMVTAGEADFLVVLAPDQVAVNQAALSPNGILIEPSQIDESSLSNKKSINVALLGVLSRHLQFPVEAWIAALKRNLPEKLHEANLLSFSIGRGEGPAKEQAK
ncbi:2-oxoacid:acceptor oxidoreductase family protein [Cupriavidus basilensis]|uniref:2-oxoacid:acceptor oxidoreductase family protein n=1 Tax=Cupriavidus basilensis TaxID=68895 RepID=UPI002851A950|nr:2-oxoacid:acceptor oxidoreductase family protein [Cupriavidus basilensis]MDR3382897.1 2-oxoacid:acceptor oxidoreductase family protein [Cupriavidus basilensis]